MCLGTDRNAAGDCVVAGKQLTLGCLVHMDTGHGATCHGVLAVKSAALISHAL